MSDPKTTRSLITSSRRDGDALIVVVSGEIDLNNSPLLRSALMDLLAKDAPKRLVLNLGSVHYMDSSAIAVLVELLRRVGRGGKVVLTNLQPRVKGILEIARLNEIFRIVADETEAMSG
jgi:anti-anti-sigma factor